MITTKDFDYIETNLIKQGKKKLENPFKELAVWISSKFDVNVINIYYDYIDNNRPRLGVIFEFHEDERKFYKNYNYDNRKQKVISKKFVELVSLNEKKYATKNILVTFSSFEPIAKDEANEKITGIKIQELKHKLNNKDLWEISRSGSVTTFFFHTDEQVTANSSNGLLDTLRDEYFKLIKPNDEFGYIKKDSLYIKIDSKENFDKNFNSSWFYYYR